MKALRKKTGKLRSIFNKVGGKASSVTSQREIELRAITPAERDELRIPSYQYLLP